MKLFAQIRKVDEAKRLVFGRLAEEVVDKADEIMDYESSKPYFKAWSEEIAKDTNGASVGNLRAMHGKVAAGKFTEIVFDDDAKAIDVCAKVVDDNEWNKVLEGVYTGFSVGGSYVGAKKIEKADGRDVARYTAKPNEGSLVDRPCIPTAKFFEVQKADGTLAKVDFKVPADEPDLEVKGTADEVAQLAKVMNEQGLSMADVLAKLAPAATTETPPTNVTDPAKPVEKLDAGTLRKNFYTCADLANLLNSLVNIRSNAQWSAYYEGDQSPIPKRIAAVIALAGQVLKEMIDEELKELGEGASLELAEKAGGLAKFEGDDPDAALLTLIKIGARNSGSDKDRIAKIHALTLELGHTCEPAEKVEPAGTLAKADLEKAVGDAIAPLQKALGEAAEKIAKLEAQPAPATIALRVVSKAADTIEAVAKVDETKPIVDAHGEKHEAASLIKSIHNSGGRPLVQPLSK